MNPTLAYNIISHSSRRSASPSGEKVGRRPARRSRSSAAPIHLSAGVSADKRGAVRQGAPATKTLQFSSSRPHLRIIAPALWCAVEDRRKAVYENYAGRSEGAPGRRTAHPFSGLLFCGSCGHRMVDGGGASARYYRCSGATTGGVCSNRAPVREDALVDAAICKLDRLARPALQEQPREKAERRVTQYKSQTSRDLTVLQKELAKVSGSVHRLLTFIQETDDRDPPRPGSPGPHRRCRDRRAEARAQVARQVPHARGAA